MIHEIKKIIAINDLTLKLEFDRGEIRSINFEPIFRGWSTTPESKFKELLDKSNFKKVHVHPEWETIYWDNGIDLDPNVLYDMSIPIQND
jgi:hypothetical protein